MRSTPAVSSALAHPVGHAVRDLLAITTFAALTALGARIQFRLPSTPVPITGQVFFVLLAGAVLGARLGFVSQVQYLAAGAAGLPVFANGGGFHHLLGPTGGYLVAFPFAALAVGGLSQVVGRRRLALFVAGVCGVVVIHLLGACWYAVWAAAAGGGADLVTVLAQAVYPFVVADIAKAALVTVAASPIRSRSRGPAGPRPF